MHPDLVLLEDFVTPEEEQSIISNIVKTEYSPTKDRNSKQQFGVYKHTIENFDPIIPAWLDDLSEKIFQAGLLNQKPDSLSINEYFPGQGIHPHIDSKNNGEVITILALGGHTVFNLTRQNFDPIAIYFKPRSLLQMKREIRYLWQHSIEPRTSDIIDGQKIKREKRYSIVFRNSLVKN